MFDPYAALSRPHDACLRCAFDADYAGIQTQNFEQNGSASPSLLYSLSPLVFTHPDPIAFQSTSIEADRIPVVQQVWP